MVDIYYDPVFLEHDTGHHPECPSRLAKTVEHLKANRPDLADGIRGPRRATEDEIALIHEPAYIRGVKELAARGGGYLYLDTPISRRSFEAALLAAGSVIEAVERALAGPAARAFCLVRPPGHHAMPGQGMGFCLFNNAAIGARFAQRHCGAGKIAIIDPDVHHGNGTQAAFYTDPSVFYLSLHRWPFYPGTGDATERGWGDGEGFTLNCPLGIRIGREVYLKIFADALEEVRRFGPDLVIVSTGFDTYKHDPLAGLGLEIGDYRTLSEKVVDLAVDCCAGRVVSTLEGGYHVGDLPRMVEAHLDGLAGEGEEAC
jgi:acetoin utilization deacetylase AcuC-like enzyme